MIASPSARKPLRRRGRAVLILFALRAAGCGSATGPDDAKLPGRLLLAPQSFAHWAWTADGREILFGTPFLGPYGGAPAILEAVGIPGGVTRTVVGAPTNGDQIVPYGLVVQGTHVYYREIFAPDRVALYRAPLTGVGGAERVLDSIPDEISISPDERFVAWLGAGQVVTLDLTTGSQRSYPITEHANFLHWSPDGRSLVLEENGWASAGTPFQWLDLEAGTVRVWLAPPDQVTAYESRDFHWEGATPYLYTTGNGGIRRYSLATGTGELLSGAPGEALGWSADFEVVYLALNNCTKWGTFLASGECVSWEGRLNRVNWRTGEVKQLLSSGHQRIAGTLSPDRTWLAYENNGLYVVRLP